MGLGAGPESAARLGEVLLRSASPAQPSVQRAAPRAGSQGLRALSL